MLQVWCTTWHAAPDQTGQAPLLSKQLPCHKCPSLIEFIKQPTLIPAGSMMSPVTR